MQVTEVLGASEGMTLELPPQLMADSPGMGSVTVTLGRVELPVLRTT